MSLHAGCPPESFHSHLFLGKASAGQFPVCSAMTLSEPKTAPGAPMPAPNPSHRAQQVLWDQCSSRGTHSETQTAAVPVPPCHKDDTHQFTPSTRLRDTTEAQKSPELWLGNLCSSSFSPLYQYGSLTPPHLSTSTVPKGPRDIWEQCQGPCRAPVLRLQLPQGLQDTQPWAAVPQGLPWLTDGCRNPD